MKSIILTTLLVCLLSLGSALAQKTQVEIIRPTNPHDDSKSNDPNVPEAIVASGEFEQIHVFRFKYQTDLLGGIEKLVQKEGIKNAVILSGIGSVINYHVHSVSNRDFPSKNIFTKAPKDPADIVSVNGYVFDGRVHAHLTLADSEKAFGGHLEPETLVFTFAIITIAEFSEEMDLARFDDKTMRLISLIRDDILPDWNYSISPNKTCF